MFKYFGLIVFFPKLAAIYCLEDDSILTHAVICESVTRIFDAGCDHVTGLEWHPTCSQTPNLSPRISGSVLQVRRITHTYPYHIFPRFIMTGWWFGTFFVFQYFENVIIPADELIFFRGVGQPPTSY